MPVKAYKSHQADDKESLWSQRWAIIIATVTTFDIRVSAGGGGGGGGLDPSSQDHRGDIPPLLASPFGPPPPFQTFLAETMDRALGKLQDMPYPIKHDIDLIL